MAPSLAPAAATKLVFEFIIVSGRVVGSGGVWCVTYDKNVDLSGFLV